MHYLYTLYRKALSPRHDEFLLVAKIAENSSKLSDFEEKRTFKLRDDGVLPVDAKGHHRTYLPHMLI